MSTIKLIDSSFGGRVKVIAPTAFKDDRGFFSMSYHADEFSELGLPTVYPQDSHSVSHKNVVRGLHLQLSPPMGKLMRVVRGRAFLVAVDADPDSPTFLKWIGVDADEENMLQVWAPAEFARGFAALEDNTTVLYKCTGVYNPKGETGLLWNDPAIGIDWPVTDPMLSAKDRAALTVAQYLERLGK
jgi:dTDP-4-dehydrorhamnose 3,5-epimerase